MRLRTKIILLVSFTVLCVGLLSALAVSRIMRTYMEREIEHKGILVAGALSEFVTYYVINEEILPARDALQKIVQPAQGVSFAYITGFDGNIFAHSFEGGFPAGLAAKIRSEVNAKDIALDRYLTNEGPILEVRYPLIAGMRGHICIAMNMNSLHAQISAIRDRIIGLTFGITLLGIMLGVILSRRISGPLGKLMESMQAFGQGTSGDEIVLPGGNREVAELTGTFNRMISDRKRFEEALQKSEIKLQKIIDGSSAVIFAKDVDGKYLFINSLYEKLFHISRSEIIGKTDYDIFPREIADALREADLKALKADKPIEVEETVPHDEGIHYYISLKFPLYDKGVPYAICGMATDITERKKAEETLLDFQMAVDSSTDAIGMSTPEGRHYYQNEAFTKLFGLSVSEADGVSGPPSTVYADEKVGAKIFDTIMKGGSFTGEVKMLDKDRNEKDIYVRAYSIKNREGQIVGLVGIHTDITDRKRSEEKLRKRESQLMESQRVAHLGSWDLNLVSEKLEWSDETYRLFDRPPEDFVPSFNEFARLVHPDDRATMETNFFKALESDANPYHVAVRIINDSGREWVMEAFGVVRRDSSGKALSIFGTAQDITERKMAEEEVQKSLREKETLLRELYHRTKNNMQVITSLLNLQSMGIDDKKTLQILEDTKNRIQSMALVHEKLYVAKNLSQVFLSDYIKDLADALMKSHNADKEQISLQVDVARIPLSIDTITPLGLVINELMTNALKYAFPDNKKGEIIIKGSLNEDEIIELTFSDNGIGMPKNIDLTKTESLGLKIVRTLAELQMKGKLAMKTQNGTMFMIKFKDKGIPERI